MIIHGNYLSLSLPRCQYPITRGVPAITTSARRAIALISMAYDLGSA